MSRRGIEECGTGSRESGDREVGTLGKGAPLLDGPRKQMGGASRAGQASPPSVASTWV